MKYIYSEKILPANLNLLRKINFAASSLHSKLISLDLNPLGLSDYYKRYLDKMRTNPVGKLQRYGHLLSLCLSGRDIPLERFIFVDYGGGTGMLSLLARELGIGIVIYNDIYEVSCKDARKFAEAIGSAADHYICGDIDELIDSLKKKSIVPDALCSYDVIEHIYNIEEYLKKLPQLSPVLRAVLASGANIRNPHTSWRIRKTHLICEFQDRQEKWGHKQRDTLRSYFRTRRELITTYGPDLGEDAVQELATATRGLIKQDIQRCIEEFKQTGRISYIPDHPTNTCDPYTGNWAERLMRTEWLERVLVDAGFKVEILRGYWPYYKSARRRAAVKILNTLIRYLGKGGLFFSPYYILYADYSIPGGAYAKAIEG